MLPNFGDVVFLFPMYFLLALVPTFLFNDGATAGHLVVGDYIIATRRVPHQDLMSYTFPDKAWVPYAWLFDLVAALVVKLGGLPLLAVVSASAIAWLFLLLYQRARRTGCHFLIALTLTLIGCLTSSVHWLARPHLFTFFGVYIFATCLEDFHRNRLSPLRASLLLGLTMVAWSNAHPGFVIGFGMVAIYLASEAIGSVVRSPDEERRWAGKRARTLLASLALAGAASLINPNGVALYPYIATYLRQGTVLSQTQEFMSPTFHGQLQSVGLELLFLALVLGLVTSRSRPWLGQLLLVLAFAHLALASVRNEPLFVIVALPLIAELFAESGLTARSGGSGTLPGWWGAATQGWRRVGRTIDAMEFTCTMHLIPLVLVAAVAATCIAAGRLPGVPPLVTSRFDPETKPTTTLEYIEHHHLPWNRGFNFDNWGGYIRYTTGQRVFIDDRLDFYGGEFYLSYTQTVSIKPGWKRLLDEYNVEWVLLPKDAPLGDLLAQTPGWHLDAEDPAANLYVRRPVPGAPN